MTAAYICKNEAVVCKSYTLDIHLQEVTFRIVKGHLLQYKPSPFTR